MIRFVCHDSLEKDIAAMERRFHTVRQGLSAFERLCEVQFHPANPRQVIAPAKLHRISQNNVWTLWKTELVLPNSGLRPNQWPRMWFAVKGEVIVFLCIASHVDNYDDDSMNKLALSRVSDIF